MLIPNSEFIPPPSFPKYIIAILWSNRILSKSSLPTLFYAEYVSRFMSHLFIFAFISFALGDGSKKILLWFMSKSVLLMFSSGHTQNGSKTQT